MDSTKELRQEYVTKKKKVIETKNTKYKPGKKVNIVKIGKYRTMSDRIEINPKKS